MSETAQQASAPALAESTHDLSPFSSASAFDTSQRMAKALAASTLVPKQYQGNVSDCLIALEIANRLNISALSVLQNLDVIHGRPSFRAKMMIAAFNSSPDHGNIRYEWKGTPGKDDYGCRAFARDFSENRHTGELVHGPWIDIKMAKAEGWYSKNGSKWQTMAEKMLMYRAAAWFIDTFAPELMLAAPEIGGEIIDVEPITIHDPKNALGEAMAGAKQARDEGRKISGDVVVEGEQPDTSNAPTYDELNSQLQAAEDMDDITQVMACAEALPEDEAAKLLQSCKAKRLILESGDE